MCGIHLLLPHPNTTHYLIQNSGILLICRLRYLSIKGHFFLLFIFYFFFLVVLLLSLLEYPWVLNRVSLACLSHEISLLSFLSDNCNIPYKFNSFSECFTFLLPPLKPDWFQVLPWIFRSKPSFFSYTHVRYRQKVEALPTCCYFPTIHLPLHWNKNQAKQKAIFET